MRKIKARAHGPRDTIRVHQTYELYLRFPDGRVSFEPLTHKGPLAEVMGMARQVLDDRKAESLELRLGGELTMTIEAS